MELLKRRRQQKYLQTQNDIPMEAEETKTSMQLPSEATSRPPVCNTRLRLVFLIGNILFFVGRNLILLNRQQCLTSTQQGKETIGMRPLDTSTKNNEIPPPSLDSLEKSLKEAWQHMVRFCPENLSDMNYCKRKFRNAIRLPPNHRNVDYSHVTLASHTEVSRLGNFRAQVRWWGGPVSMAIFINKVEDIDVLLRFVLKYHQEMTNVTFHIYMEQKNPHGYPHNRLRNMALEAVKTDYVVPIDVDFMTNPGAHDKMLDLIRNDPEVYTRLHSKFMFSLPCFNVKARQGETFATEDQLPRTKQEVIQGARNDSMIEFHAGLNPGTHKFHNYLAWYAGYEGNRTFQEAGYEPYLELYALAYRHGLPRYNEDLRGFGFDKVTFFIALRAMDYKFGTLRDFWAAHLYHPFASGADAEAQRRRNWPVYLGYKHAVATSHGKDPENR